MMRNKDYFNEMGTSVNQIEEMLDAASERIFMFHRFLEEKTLFRFKARKTTYRIKEQTQRTQSQM